jgi:hypothetical protein
MEMPGRRLSLLSSEVRTGVTLTPTADIYVRDGSTAGQNFGTAAPLAAKTNPQAGLNRRIFMKFDISSLTSVSSAKLRLFGNFTAASGTSLVVLHREDIDSWTETGLTWNNQPAVGVNQPAVGPAVVTSLLTLLRSWEWDLTAFVQNQIATGQHTMSLVLQNDITTSDSVNFNSRSPD